MTDTKSETPRCAECGTALELPGVTAEIARLQRDLATAQSQLAEARRALAEARESRDGLWNSFLAMRGIESPEDACPNCGGAGWRVYGSTSTWRGGIGGQMMTGDVCDKCWGSGHKERKWPSHRAALASLAPQSQEKQDE